MVASVFIAKLFGPIFALSGIALLLRAETYRAIVGDFLRSPALHYLAGFLGLFAGLAIVLTHNVWAFDWRLIITLIGWVTIVRAAVTVLWPEWIVPVGNVFLEYRAAPLVGGAINLLIGLALSYFGYFA